MTTSFKLPVAEPSLKDLLDLLKKDIFLSLNCHHLATVQSFNSTACTVTATINYGKTYYEQQDDGTYQTVVVNYPVLTDIPVIRLGGGSCTLTMPIAAGDQAIVLFNDRDIDNWFQNVRSGSPNTSRLHSLSDGIALVGLNSVSGYDAVRALLSNGTVKLGINPSNNKVTLQNSVTSLKDILTGSPNGLLTLLSTFFSTVSTATTVAQIATAAGLVSNGLSTTTTEVGELLE